jgi:hypothetical protein
MMIEKSFRGGIHAKRLANHILGCRYYAKPERFDCDKHSSLLQYRHIYNCKRSYNIDPGDHSWKTKYNFVGK